MKWPWFAFVFLLSMSGSAQKETMTPKSRYKPTAELVRQAEVLRGHSSKLPIEAVQGYPVPVQYNGRVALAFPFFNIRGKPPNAPEVMPPRWIMYIDAVTGDQLVLVEREGDFTKPLGRHEMEKMSLTELSEKQRRIFALYDDLLPVAFDKARRTQETARELQEFRHLWTQVTHKPLINFYRELSPLWFRFVEL